MFRKMRRFKQELSEEACKKVLLTEGRGVLSLKGDEGYPYGIPLDFFYDEEKNKIYFHGATEGHKIDALMADDKASFCVYDNGVVEEGEWAPTIHSVILFGRVQKVPNTDETMELLRQMARKYYPDEEEVEKGMKSADRVQMLEFTIEHMSGKLIHEK